MMEQQSEAIALLDSSKQGRPFDSMNLRKQSKMAPNCFNLALIPIPSSQSTNRQPSVASGRTAGAASRRHHINSMLASNAGVVWDE